MSPTICPASSSPASSNPSPIDVLTGGRWKPIWSIRVMTGLALLSCLLAMMAFRSGFAHDFWVGMTFGLLVGLLAQSFAIETVART